MYDLNCAQELRPIETSQRFSLIVFAEVIEHLYTATELTLFVLSELLEPGGRMIIQTLGIHPYQRFSINNRNPAHYREYTKGELIDIIQIVGLGLISHEYKDYFAIYGSPVLEGSHVATKDFFRGGPSFLHADKP
ncbi:MAG: hypothetical protein WBW81_12655 [Methylocella sp.]